ncbi:MAG: hypothetical protein JST93_13930 [Acidobacteria bacterium]|nr:hypothetical protein [Acidobacteriota bacterium]
MPNGVLKIRTQPQPRRWVSVPFNATRGLHPALARLGWLGPEYLLNDLREVTLDAVAELLRAHPVVLCAAVSAKATPDSNAKQPACQEDGDLGGDPAVADAYDEEDDHGRDLNRTDATPIPDAASIHVQAASADVRRRSAPGGSRAYFVVGGLRSWQVAAAVNARLPNGKGRGLWLPALVVPREPDEIVVARARAERYLEQLLYCLKPATAARQLAETWTEFFEQGELDLRKLTPHFTSQERHSAAIGYASRSAFRSLHKAEATVPSQSPDGLGASSSSSAVSHAEIGADGPDVGPVTVEAFQRPIEGEQSPDTQSIAEDSVPHSSASPDARS